MIKLNDVFKLIVSLILCQLAGIIGSFFTRPAIPTWYQTLNKPNFTPPNWLFGPVWISLYILMGLSLFLIWRKKPQNGRINSAFAIFFIQLILNAFWSIAFFGFRSPLFGLVIIILLWIGLLLTIIQFARLSFAASVLLWPYFLWVNFASLLNFSIWLLNR
ncbi:MAG: tryptophan-rich sensory protein [Candidatus Aminicenantes bacterium]|nr:tryptophan-rich sensory protein [Candidatus Aminicenantes bacterium]